MVPGLVEGRSRHVLEWKIVDSPFVVGPARGGARSGSLPRRTGLHHSNSNFAEPRYAPEGRTLFTSTMTVEDFTNLREHWNSCAQCSQSLQIKHTFSPFFLKIFFYPEFWFFLLVYWVTTNCDSYVDIIILTIWVKSRIECVLWSRLFVTLFLNTEKLIDYRR